jgi:DedD protein
MEEGSKRRLVGTAVVVVLLVIFLPMLLEEEPADSLPDADLQIPPRPQFEADIGERPSPSPGDSVALPVTPELPAPDSYESLGSAEAEAPTEPYSAAPPAAVPDDVPVADESPPPSPEVTAEPSRSEPKPARQERAEPTAMKAQKGPGWVLQVSSLREERRARDLERQLKSEGFPVFIEMAEVEGKVYHRVRVGPRNERWDIERLAASVKDKTGYQGQILRYP